MFGMKGHLRQQEHKYRDRRYMGSWSSGEGSLQVEGELERQPGSGCTRIRGTPSSVGLTLNTGALEVGCEQMSV